MTTHASPNHTQSDGHPSPAGPLHRWVLPIKAPKPVNPVLVKHAEQRAEYEQNRIADAITTFAGSMTFVYIHIVWFGCWIGFGVEKYPFGLLTMIVSANAANPNRRRGPDRPVPSSFRGGTVRRLERCQTSLDLCPAAVDALVLSV
jgi:hypothetical protein